MPIYNTCADADRQTRVTDTDDIAGRQSPVSQATTSGRTSPSTVFNPYYTGRPRTPAGGPRTHTVDRQEIIRRIKSRDDRSRPTSPELERQIQPELRDDTSRHGEADATITDTTVDQETSNYRAGMQIERPRSALHRGDFRERETSLSAFETFAAGESQQDSQAVLSTSPPAPWHHDFQGALLQGRPQPSSRFPRQRTASSILPGRHFIYQAPTSPLVQSSRPDTPPPHARSPERQSRRHTFSPRALAQFANDFDAPRHGQPSNVPSLRKEATYPYQAHQPQRSIHSAFVPGSPPRPRRPSAASEAHSPLHHAPLVGSYEESILRGRMSTTPSKPLNFIAQIGVLGKGDCKSSLRCPPHVTVPFPAVFYSYSAASRNGTDQPSPYVGLVDLENDLPSHVETMNRRRQRLGERLQAAISDEGSRANSKTRDDASSEADAQAKRRRRQHKAQRRSDSPRAPHGGCYRIPQQGQLQIVIKNPNKTAVKLFLVPYDLSDMSPGQKTFIRQRSYSAGPIIDMPLSSRKNLGTDRPEASLTNSEDPNDRPVLRYLVHLHICCTSKGRYWLYKSVRVVFANRVPDGKEKLRNEIQLPEPRYSTYKAGRDSIGVTSIPNSPAADPARRNSDRYAASLPASDIAHEISSFRFPFRAPLLPTLMSRPGSSHASTNMDIDTHSEAGPLSPTSSGSFTDRTWAGLDEPFTFARHRSHENTDATTSVLGESLISQELKRLDM